MKKYDVVVVGGGHAGCEEATAAARIGAKTLCDDENIKCLHDIPPSLLRYLPQGCRE